MSDEELDRDWKPSNRPQSTMAKSFSLALNDLFKIDNSVADLDAAVSEKKRVVSTQTSELEALEARIKATEERLKASAHAAGIDPNLGRTPSGRSSPRNRTPLGDTFAAASQANYPTSPLATDFTQDLQREKRPNAEGNYSAPGALPPTPGASEGESGSDAEYVVVERNISADAFGVEDGDATRKP